MPENAGGAALDTSPSVADYIGNLMGDFPTSSEPESEEAGATPAPTPEGQEPTADSSEGTEPSVESETPDATEPAPDPSSTTPTADADPLEGATPFAYVVNGQERQFEGITVLKDGGAIVDPDALEKIQRVFGERDHLYERDRERHQESQTLGKFIEWTPPGSDKALQGVEAAKALHLSRAELMAEVRAFHTLLSDPENIRKIVTADENNRLVWNEQGVENFRLLLENTKGKVQGAVNKFFADKAQPASPQAFNPADHASTATAAAVKALGPTPKGWSAEDKAWAEALAPRFIRLATIEDQRVNPALAVGEPMVEQQFIDLVKDRAAQRASTAKVATSAADAAKANQARIAAAKVGQKPTAAKPQITPQKEPERTREEDFEDAWERRERAAAGALRAHQAGLGR